MRVFFVKMHSIEDFRLQYDFRTQYCILEHSDEFYFCSSHSCHLIIIQFDLEMSGGDVYFFSHTTDIFFLKMLFHKKLILYFFYNNICYVILKYGDELI